jgi:hypothetical protein
MEIRFPIYVLERDDFSFREFSCLRHVDFFEKDDVLGGLYEGWDSSGRHLNIHWDDDRDTATVLVDEHRSVGAFSDAVERYAEICQRHGLKFDGGGTVGYTRLCDPTYLRLRLSQIRQQ